MPSAALRSKIERAHDADDAAHSVARAFTDGTHLAVVLDVVVTAAQRGGGLGREIRDTLPLHPKMRDVSGEQAAFAALASVAAFRPPERRPSSLLAMETEAPRVRPCPSPSPRTSDGKRGLENGPSSCVGGS